MSNSNRDKSISVVAFITMFMFSTLFYSGCDEYLNDPDTSTPNSNTSLSLSLLKSSNPFLQPDPYGNTWYLGKHQNVNMFTQWITK